MWSETGCILLPLLFSLYVNSCGSQLISVLLYADDAVILADDEKSMRRGLETLDEWCSEWAVEINVEKCVGDAYEEEKSEEYGREVLCQW